jgi:hypothetical protein
MWFFSALAVASPELLILTGKILPEQLDYRPPVSAGAITRKT